MRHVYADLIIAWAEGAKIETQNEFSKAWVITNNPRWYEHFEYRIKPREPRRFWLNTNPGGNNCCHIHNTKETVVKYYDYDGETIEVVEVIKDE